MAVARTPGKVQLPVGQTIGARGVALAMAEMCSRNILPCTPFIDIGFDLISAYRHVLKRVQVKATSVHPSKNNGNFTFSVKRRKNWRLDKKNAPGSRSYEDNEIDVFIFVHTTMQLFFVVPADEIDYQRHKISFSLDSQWRNAWNVLKA